MSSASANLQLREGTAHDRCGLEDLGVPSLDVAPHECGWVRANALHRITPLTRRVHNPW